MCLVQHLLRHRRAQGTFFSFAARPCQVLITWPGVFNVSGQVKVVASRSEIWSLQTLPFFSLTLIIPKMVAVFSKGKKCSGGRRPEDAHVSCFSCCHHFLCCLFLFFIVCNGFFLPDPGPETPKPPNPHPDPTLNHDANPGLSDPESQLSNCSKP